MNNEVNNASEMVVGSVHPFERAGLGLAPFRCVGTYEKKFQACPGAPVQPGASCDYCGTGIVYICVIRSADGKQFQVGCDCVGKLERADNTPEDRRMISKAKAFAKEQAKASRKASEARRLGELADLMSDAATVEKMKAATRTRTGWNGQPVVDTVWDWATWMIANAGTRGKLQVLSAIKKL